MSAGKGVDLATAAAAAGELRDLLAPGCERIAVAGSIRRQKPVVHDIELVAIAKIETVDAGQLWGATIDVDRLEERVSELIGSGHLVARDVTLHRADGSLEVSHRMGSSFKALVYRGLPVDLFIVRPPAEWGVIFALRTGPGDWNTRLVTEAHRFMRRVEGGRVYAGGQVVPCPEEEDFFAAIGQEWIDPPARHRDRVRLQRQVPVPA